MFKNLKKTSTVEKPFTSVESSTEVSATTTTELQPTITAPKAPPIKYGMIPVELPQVQPMQPFIREYEEQTGVKSYDIYIYCPIGYALHFALDMINIITHAQTGSNIRIYICSPGGSLEAGAQICSAILRSKATITTISTGITASAAALIWSYGKIRLIEPGAFLMFHCSSHMDWGNSESIRKSASDLVEYVKFIALTPLVQEGFITEEELNNIIEKQQDLYLDSVEVMKRLSAKNVPSEEN